MVSNIFYATHALKVTFGIIGTVGVLDNLFVIIVFVFFIKIADKVTCSLITFNNTHGSVRLREYFNIHTLWWIRVVVEALVRSTKLLYSGPG